MTSHLTVGFIPLVDAALLVAARDMGFAEAEGLTLDLVRDVTWANLRDRLAVGQIDAAHMLAPAALAVSLGSHQIKVPVATPIALNRDGNAIAVSLDLADRLAGFGYTPEDGPAASAKALAAVVAERQARGAPDLVLATVYPYSMHSLLLDAWLGGAGLKSAGCGLRIEVVPPPLLVEAIKAGEIDGFCGGAPWHAVAAETGHGIVLHLGIDLVADAPEKVLAFRAEDIDARSTACDQLVRALVAAAGWCAEPGNLGALAALLARRDVLDVPAALIERVLAGHRPAQSRAMSHPAARLIRFDQTCLRPRFGDVDMIMARMERAGLIEGAHLDPVAARRVFRPDAYDRAIGAAAA
jgi:ABC-type nitrate/sulfonate/bicarbonate transport system substrate-binding protein